MPLKPNYVSGLCSPRWYTMIHVIQHFGYLRITEKKWSTNWTGARKRLLLFLPIFLVPFIRFTKKKLLSSPCSAWNDVQPYYCHQFSYMCVCHNVRPYLNRLFALTMNIVYHALCTVCGMYVCTLYRIALWAHVLFLYISQKI